MPLHRAQLHLLFGKNNGDILNDIIQRLKALHIHQQRQHQLGPFIPVQGGVIYQGRNPSVADQIALQIVNNFQLLLQRRNIMDNGALHPAYFHISLLFRIFQKNYDCTHIDDYYDDYKKNVQLFKNTHHTLLFHAPSPISEAFSPSGKPDGGVFL